jgi:hypothetical protein
MHPTAVGCRVTEVPSRRTQGCGNALLREGLAALPDAYRALLMEEAAPAGAQAVIAGYVADDERNLPMIEAGLTQVTYTEDQIDEIRSHAETVWAAWVEEMEGKGIPGRELLDHILTSARELLAGN